jgi:hypothetical protein
MPRPATISHDPKAVIPGLRMPKAMPERFYDYRSWLMFCVFVAIMPWKEAPESAAVC